MSEKCAHNQLTILVSGWNIKNFIEYWAESRFKAPITGHRNKFIVGLQRENGALNYQN